MKDAAIVILFILLSILLLFSIVKFRITGMFVYSPPYQLKEKWWNDSWRYRVKIEINSTNVDRTNWPIELKINFTSLLESLGVYGTFDENSTRIIEYIPSSNKLIEIPSQFDKSENYNPSTNAYGEVVFIMNGTTSSNSNRTFFLYFDILENGAKTKPSYPTNLSYSFDGKIINVNTTKLWVYIDTNRAENTSGIFRVIRDDSVNIIDAEENERTAEYQEYSNGTHNLTFFLNGSAEFIVGPVRITVKQVGNEIVFGNPSQQTNEAALTKKYYFYAIAGKSELGSFIKIEQNISNAAIYTIQRNSTWAGALAFDNESINAWNFENIFVGQSDPYSYVRVIASLTNYLIEIVNLQEENTENFFATNRSMERVGINLNLTSIGANEWISEKASVYFGAWGGDLGTEAYSIRASFQNPEAITIFPAEQLSIQLEGSTNATIFNRNETVRIVGNATYDPYNETAFMNATLDMGTSDPSDDVTIQLYDDGAHEDDNENDNVFANLYILPNTSTIGKWKINITAYTSNLVLLNSTVIEFNVTDFLNVLTLLEKKVFMESTIVKGNVSAKNYRNDSVIINAYVNCSYNGNYVENISEVGNGIYDFNFTAPSVGEYFVNCSVSKNGNFGFDEKNFTVEAAKTNVSVTTTPANFTASNITIYDSQYFEVIVNLTNVGNGTAYSLNVTLEVPSNWEPNSTFEVCGDLASLQSCLHSFNITITNATSPAVYLVNFTATWRNPDSTLNSTKKEFSVNVTQNPKIDILETSMYAEIPDGIEVYIGNFSIKSIGNYKLTNITFSKVGLEDFNINFQPKNVSELEVGATTSIAINISSPLDYPIGTYEGKINSSAENDRFDTLNLTIKMIPNTSVMVKTIPTSYIASNITLEQNESFELSVNATNIGQGNAKFVNITLTLPAGWLANRSIEECDNLTVIDRSCEKGFLITIPNATSPGVYTIYANVTWKNLDSTTAKNYTTVSVEVKQNPKIDVLEKELVVFTNPDNVERTIGNFTVLSKGNYNLTNVNATVINTTNIVIEFIPSLIQDIPPGGNVSVDINITVPLGHQGGWFNYTINVSSQNDGFDTFVLSIFVQEFRYWEMVPTNCTKATVTDVGDVCEVNITSTGNAPINFTIVTIYSNYTQTNVTNFTVEWNGSYVFKVTYNVTGVPPGIYESLYNVTAIQNATPQFRYLSIKLLPYVPPVINISVYPNKTQQNTTINISVNVTDVSGAGIKIVKGNVTTPSNLTYELNLTLFNISGNISTYIATFPEKNGTTNEKGNYTVTIYAEDNVGNYKIENSTFLIYTKILVYLSTVSPKYYQGDTGRVTYVTTDFNGNGIQANVSLSIYDPNFTLIARNEYKTEPSGEILPTPTFSITSDAPTGNYTLHSKTRYYEQLIDEILEEEKNSSFLVLQAGVVAGIQAELETTVVWYPNSVMKFVVSILDAAGAPTNATYLNLTVYKPDGQVYFSTSELVHETTGLYSYSYAMPSGTPTGAYLAILKAKKDEFETQAVKYFRVASGGPYDVKLRLLEGEVSQGDYLDFEITLVNMGEVGQDVKIDYWVEDPNNNTWVSYTEMIYTPAISNQTFTRNAYIYNNQPVGNYYLKLKVTYDNTQPPLFAQATFMVISKEARGPYYGGIPEYNVTIPVGRYEPVPEVKEKVKGARVSIIFEKTEVSVVKEIEAIEGVRIENTGEVKLTNLVLSLIGIPSSWYSIKPLKVPELDVKNYVTFLITFKVGKEARIGTYNLTLVAISDQASEKKEVKFVVYESVEGLISSLLEKLRNEINNLEIRMETARKAGKDISKVKIIFEKLMEEFTLAQQNFEVKKYTDSMQHLGNANNLLIRANILLDAILGEKELLFPFWVVLLAVICSSLTVFGIMFWLRKKRLEKIKPPTETLRIMIEKIRPKTKKMEPADVEKVKRILELLESQYKQGKIKEKVYLELKKNLEEKLRGY